MADKPICSIPDCGKPARSRGSFCQSHYYRQRRYGDPLGGRTALGAPMAFLENALVTETSECITWPFGKDRLGRGRVWFNGRKRHAARVVCELAHGAPPTPKHHAAHSCGKGHEGCVSPEHLRWATAAENCADKLVHGTAQRGERGSSVKLIESEVREIRRLRGEVTQRGLAKRFGVSVSTIKSIQARRNWAWLT